MDEVSDIRYVVGRISSDPNYHVIADGYGHTIRDTCGNVVGSIEPEIGALSGPANNGKLSFFDVNEIDNIRNLISE